MLPQSDTDFWWMRYGLGVIAPLVSTAWGLCSIVTQHSYVLLRRGPSVLAFMPVHGLQAILVGIAFLGLALALFSNFYGQYHEKMAYYYQWPMACGLVLMIGGSLWSSWIFIAG
jgi:hypothetical protein